MTPSLSTASPLGRPILRIVRRLSPSALMCVMHPLPGPISTISQLRSGKRTGPSGALKFRAKNMLSRTGQERSWRQKRKLRQRMLARSGPPCRLMTRQRSVPPAEQTQSSERGEKPNYPRENCQSCVPRNSLLPLCGSEFQSLATNAAPSTNQVRAGRDAQDADRAVGNGPVMRSAIRGL